MKAYYILGLAFAISVIACDKDDPPAGLQPRGEVNLSTPLSRQKTTYQRFSSHCSQGNFVTDTDTIILEVVLDGGLKYFDEYGTPGSRNSEIRNHSTRMQVIPEIDVLRIFDRSDSYLFSSFPSDEILIDSTYSQVLWQSGCDVRAISDSSEFAGNQPGFINAFVIDTSLSLDKKYMAAAPVQLESIKKYVIYDGKHLHVSYEGDSASGTITNIDGWMRLDPQ